MCKGDVYLPAAARRIQLRSFKGYKRSHLPCVMKGNSPSANFRVGNTEDNAAEGRISCEVLHILVRRGDDSGEGN